MHQFSPWFSTHLPAFFICLRYFWPFIYTKPSIRLSSFYRVLNPLTEKLVKYPLRDCTPTIREQYGCIALHITLQKTNYFIQTLTSSVVILATVNNTWTLYRARHLLQKNLIICLWQRTWNTSWSRRFIYECKARCKYLYLSGQCLDINVLKKHIRCLLCYTRRTIWWNIFCY